VAALSQLVNTALANDHGLPDSGQPLFEIRTHQRYNPAAVTALNVVPGLLGTILTLTMLIFTALSVTRETERGTMEACSPCRSRRSKSCSARSRPMCWSAFCRRH
jgi:ABC-2 type transport system permease protein